MPETRPDLDKEDFEIYWQVWADEVNDLVHESSNPVIIRRARVMLLKLRRLVSDVSDDIYDI